MSRRILFAAALLPLLLMVETTLAKDRLTQTKVALSPRAELERQFRDALSRGTMIGRYTIDGKSEEPTPGTDRYQIERVEKIHGDRWLITARIKYGQHDTLIPVPLYVFWAGDTPVISLTKISLPGLGTFTARVMVYGDRYAGTWQHDKVGGHMWGRIEHANELQPKVGIPKTE